MAEVLVSGLVSLAVVAGYMLVKRFRRSKCACDALGCKIDSPADVVELQRKETDRLQKVIDDLILNTENAASGGITQPLGGRKIPPQNPASTGL